MTTGHRSAGSGDDPEVRQAKRGRLSRDSILAIALTAILCIAGMWALLASTRLGPVVWTDSIIYLTGARNWLAGLGLSWSTCDAIKPSIVYPPLFPLMLAGFDLLRVDPVQAGRLINIAAYGLSGALVAIYAARATRAPLAGPVAALLFLVAPGIAGMHLGMMTDGPYLTFCLIALLFLAAYSRNGRAWLLIVAGAAAGMAYLTRYIGLALVLSGVVFLALRSTRWRTLVREAIVFAGIALAPIALWYARNLVVSGSLSAYRILLREIDVVSVLAGLQMTWDWFLPGFLLRAIGQSDMVLVSLSALALIALFAGGVFLTRRIRRTESMGRGDTIHALIALVFLLVYLGVYFGSVVAVFIPPTISERYLAPAYTMLLILVVMAAVYAWRKSGWFPRAVIVLVTAVLVWNKGLWSRGLLAQAYSDGLAYTSVEWRNSATIARIRDLEPGLIYSNDVAAVAFLADRPACTLPDAFRVSTAEVDFNPESPAAFRNRLQSEGAVLVLFNRAPPETYADVVEGLVLLDEYPDGRIYGANQPGR